MSSCAAPVHPADWKVLLSAILALVFSGLAATSAEPAAVRPYRGVAYTESDIQEVRHLVKETQEGEEIARAVLERASQWMKRSDQEIMALVPKPGDLFAQGFAGDPKTGKPWPTFGRSDDVCSLDRPGQVKSPQTGEIYGIQKPGEEFYDDGTGWVRPADGRRFFFKGVWNSYVIGQLHKGVDDLSLAYMLVGDPEMARKALLILDRLATLRAESPSGIGLADAVGKKTDKVSFFNYQGNLANYRVVTSVLALDLIGRAPFASQPSSRDPAVSVFDNIATNYFDLYEREYYLDQRGSLGNHGMILFGNVVAQGVLFGKPDLLKSGLDALYGFLDSSINRDGDYFELAGAYGGLGRSYVSRLAATLVNYKRDNYENAGAMPDPADYPFDLRIADDPRWYEAVIGMLYRLPVLGRQPQYGDVDPDLNVQLGTNRAFLDAERRKYLRMFYWQTTREDWKREMERLYATLPEPGEPTADAETLLLYGKSQWNGLPPPDKKAAAASSDLMGGKNIAILRAGSAANSRALFVRGGANAMHGHDDQMAIVPYGNGMVLAGVYGYHTSETPDHLGWGSRAASHLTATVNEDLPPSYLYKGFGNRMNNDISAPAASVTGFVGSPPAQFVEMSNPGMWSHVRDQVSDFRRTSWLIDVSADRYYFVDIFRITGGRVHDYFWNAPYSSRSSGAFEVHGVQPEPVPNVWTLAALSGNSRKEEWNRPGQSWGERLDGMAGGRILPLPGKKDEPGLSGQRHPPVAPGNGYGMIWDVKACQTDQDWEAVWRLQDKQHKLKARLLNFDGMTAVTGRSPTLLRDRHFDVIVARRTLPEGAPGPLQSRFANVIEVGQPGEWSIENVERFASDGNDSVGLKVSLANGSTDFVLSNRKLGDLSTDGVKFSGRNAFVRMEKDKTPSYFLLQEGTRLEAGGWIIEPAQSALEAKVLAVDPNGSMVIDRTLPKDGAIKGAMLLIKSPKDATIPSTHDEYYAIEDVADGAPGQSILRFQRQSLVLAAAQVESISNNTIECRWPCEVAGSPGSGYLRGRAMSIQDDQPPVATVKSFVRKTLDVTSANGIRPGQHLKILAAQPGDTIVIPATVTLTRQEQGVFRIQTTADVRLTIPAAPGTKLMASLPDGSGRQIGEANAQGFVEASLVPDAAETILRLCKP